MSTLIGIIFGIVFLVFLGKAICETIYGVTLMIIGLTLMGFSKILDGIVWIGKNLRYFENPQIITASSTNPAVSGLAKILNSK